MLISTNHNFPFITKMNSRVYKCTINKILKIASILNHMTKTTCINSNTFGIVEQRHRRHLSTT